MTTPQVPADGIDLGQSKADRAWTYVIFGGGGLLVLLVAPLLSDWLASIPVVPFKGVLEWVGSFDQTWAWIARPVMGLILGLVVAVLAVADERHLIVSHDTVVIVHDQDRRTLRRDQIVGIHRDGKKVTIDGDSGRVLFDHRVEAPKDAVRAAFVDRGYPYESD
ncbi:YqeB family protein [Demetria terragena]|uniref:YqeB family protein n=1 Tax=Demetria terragena TaxID=63959 RepID=UPI0003812745|nr:hypothetical protein [Demetria terragena]